MTNIRKRFVAGFLAVMMMISCMPLDVFAADLTSSSVRAAGIDEGTVPPTVAQNGVYEVEVGKTRTLYLYASENENVHFGNSTTMLISENGAVEVSKGTVVSGVTHPASGINWMPLLAFTFTGKAVGEAVATNNYGATDDMTSGGSVSFTIKVVESTSDTGDDTTTGEDAGDSGDAGSEDGYKMLESQSTYNMKVGDTITVHVQTWSPGDIGPQLNRYDNNTPYFDVSYTEVVASNGGIAAIYELSITAKQAGNYSIEYLNQKIAFNVSENASSATTYNVSFNANGGNGNKDAVTTDDANYTLPENPFTRDGYTFKGWSTSANGEVLSGSITLTGDTTLYAIWEQNQTVFYNITFSAGEGSGSMNADTATGSYVLPANGFTAPEGKEFVGWNVNGTVYAAGETVTITGDTSITATWKQKETTGDSKYTELNGGETYNMVVGDVLYFTCYGYNSPTARVGWDGKGCFEVISETKIADNTYEFALKAIKKTDSTVSMVFAGNSETHFNVTDKPAVMYNITFAAGEGTGEMAAVTAGETYQLPACTFTAPEDYEFAGWEVNGNVHAAGETVTISGDTTITATWKALPTKLNVNFANLQGNTAEAVETRASYTIDLPTSLQRDGYNFLGWAENEVADLGKQDAVSSYYNNTYTVPADATDDITLYAVWQQQPADVNVAFDVNGGNGSINGTTVKEGASFTLPTASGLSKDGMVLVGWSTAPVADLAQGASVPAGVLAPGASYTIPYDEYTETTFYAVWQVEPQKTFIENGKTYYILQGESITLYYYGDSGNPWHEDGNYIELSEGEFTDEKMSGTDLKARPVTVTGLKPTSAEGERVYNYYCGLDGSTGGKEFRVVVTESTGTVTFVGNNGTDETATANAPSFAMPTAGFTAPEGKVLYGWSESADTDYLDGTYYAPGYQVTDKDGDQTYYAVWGPEVKITFNANGGEGTVEGTQAKANTTYKLPGKDGLTAPEGKCFFGWSESANTEYTDAENILSAGTEITLRQDTEYFAVWGPQVTLSYDLNGGSGAVPESTTDDPGFTVKLAGIDGIVAPENKLFKGWGTTADATTVYQPGIDVGIKQDTVMYAIWVDAATATFVNGSDVIDPITVPAGEEITLPSGNGLTPPADNPDYVFYGWATPDQTPDTETETGFHRAGEKVALSENTAYTAVWGPAKMQITVNVNHYYINGNNKTIYETETIVLKANDPAFAVSKKDYAANTMVYRADETISVSGVEDAVIDQQNGTVTFDTTKVAMDGLNGTVNVDFYYDAIYTLSYRSNAYTGYKEYKPGKTGYFPYGDRVLNTDKTNIWPIDDKVGTWNELKNAPKSVQGAGGYGDGYENNGNEPYQYQYQLPGSDELYDFDSNNLPPPGSIIIYRYKLSSADQQTKIVYDQRYLNAFNNQFINPNKWETMTKNATFEEAIHFGETITFNLWRFAEFDTYQPYHESLNPIGYYKHSGFTLWLYSDQEFQPNGMTKSEVEALDYTYEKGVPFVVTGLYKGYQPRLELLYEGAKPVWFEIEYYVDDVKVYETFNVHVFYDNVGHKHTVQPLPSDATSDVWTFKTFDKKGNERPESEDSYFNPYSNIVKVKPGESFNMIDANIKYYAYTTIDVTYVSENAELGTVTHALDQPNGKSGQTVLGSTAQTINGSQFLGWYKGDTLITADATLTPELVHANLNIREDGSITDGWYMDTEFVAKFVAGDAKKYPYVVKHFYQQENGEYVERIEFREAREGVAGQTVSANPKFISGYRLNADHPNAVPTGVVVEDGSLELRLYYNLIYKTTYKYEYDENFSDADKKFIEATYPLPGAKNGLKQEDVTDKPADWNVEGDYYVFVGWTAEPENLVASGNGYKHQKTENGTTVGSDIAYIGTWKKVRTDITGTKFWVGDNGIAHVNSKELDIHLYRSVNGGAKEEVEIAETWYMDDYTFSNLPIYDNNGNKYTYTVSEDKVYGYGTTQSGFDFTNTFGDIPKFDVKITKIWDDGDDADGLRPDEISVQIYANNEPYGTPHILTSGNNWSYELQLPSEDVDGLIQYALQEMDTEGYETAIEGDPENGYVIRNTRIPEKTTVTVNKVWEDDDNRAGTRPQSIILILMKGEDEEKTEVQRISLNVTAENTLSYTFTDLNKNEKGEAIKYSVDEIAVPGYEKTISEDGLTVTNSLMTGSLKIVKTFENKPEGMDFSGIEFTVTGPDGYERKVSYNELANDEITINGLVPGEYTVVESGAEIVGYDLTVTGNNAVAAVTAAGEAEVTINNAYEKQLTSVTATKVWNDNDDQDGLRADVTLNLYKQVGETKALVESKTIAKDAADLTVTWNELPEYEGDVKIVYTVTENELAGYTTSITGDAENGFTVTNTHTPATADVTVKKVWDDGDDRDGFRPDEVTFELYGNDNLVETVTFGGEGNEWSYTFEALPVKTNGSDIVYSVKETGVPAVYTASIDGLTITNTYAVQNKTLKITKIWDDETNKEGFRPDSVVINVTGNGVTKAVIVKGEMTQNTWTADVEVQKYADGKEIAYTLSDEKLDNYNAPVIDNDTLTVTNGRAVESKKITITKIWDDAGNIEGFRPEKVSVKLYANGSELQDVELSGSGNTWTKEVEVQKFANGTEIEYTITEDQVAKYELPVINSLTVKNSREVETKDVTVTKNWDDGDNRDNKRPATITLQLKNGNEVAYSADVTVDKVNNSQSYTFQNMQVYKNGQAITYTVDEENVNEYKKTLDGLTVKNSYTPGVTSVTVTKVWEDANNQDGIRPTSV
ncbi:MAG: Cna B-type domain-containing protein, partial [Clostridia bacterium]|nr:Cna B-type domain-containing protein [Clostridia bacterium]